MESVYITRDCFDKQEPVCSNSIESLLYRDNNKVHKIIRPGLFFKKETMVDYLHDNPIPHTPTPLKKIVDPENESFIGYTMSYLNGYSNVGTFINTSKSIEEYDYESRKKACLQLISTVERIINQGLIHWDLHSNNVMYNNGNVFVVDTDSMISEDLGITHKDSLYCPNKTREQLLNKMYFFTTLTIIELLTNITRFKTYFISSEDKNRFMYLKHLYSYLLDECDYIKSSIQYDGFKPNDMLEELDEDKAKTVFSLLNKKK